MELTPFGGGKKAVVGSSSLTSDTSSLFADASKGNGLTPGSFGLDQVDNTADLDKPVSLALEQELLQKIQLADDAPISSNSPCQIGEVYSSAEYFYVCVAENTWKRTNLDSAW